METRRLGKSSLIFSVIGYGTFALGGEDWEFGWGPQDEKEAIYSIQYAIDNGINWIDTAPAYGLGNAEKIVAKALKGRRDKVFIATKCGRVWNKENKLGHNLKKESILKEVEASLERLNTDYIDLYQIHWPVPDEDIEEAWQTIQTLKKQGKIRYAGVSNFNVEQMERIKKFGEITSLQPPYSMLRDEIEKEILPYCKKNSIGVIVYSPLQKGLLTGKFDHKYLETLHPKDHRKRVDKFFQEPVFSITLDCVEKLKEIANSIQISITHLALLWVLRKEEITSAIVGMRNIKQVKDIISLPETKLSIEIINEIEKILENYKNELSKI